MHLRQTIDDGHPVDLFVVLRLDVLTGQEFEDRGADLDAVAVTQLGVARDLLVVDVGAVGRAVVDAVPGGRALLEVRVTARDAVAFEHDVVLGAPADADGARVEHEPAPEQARLLGVDDHQAVVALRRPVAPPEWFELDGGDSSFLFGLAHAPQPRQSREPIEAIVACTAGQGAATACRRAQSVGSRVTERSSCASGAPGEPAKWSAHLGVASHRSTPRAATTRARARPPAGP